MQGGATTPTMIQRVLDSKFFLVLRARCSPFRSSPRRILLRSAAHPYPARNSGQRLFFLNSGHPNVAGRVLIAAPGAYAAVDFWHFVVEMRLR
jgi:hypothetical protein